MKRDIENIEDIKVLVDEFYGKVRTDQLLGPIFAGAIGDNWDPHLEKMYRFWQTVLLDEYTYAGSPFLPHSQLPIEGKHFERWINLFYETLDEHFSGANTQKAKDRAEKMAQMFRSKIEYYRNHPGRTPLK